ncbi:carnitine 3-dehydrogenase [Ensifer adhaerens]|jgi:carnitine 3-dehydrogenase|uniref:L-carnitine dehydrogenase n=1 Tax=Ensifer adhaerens TaxID=106592 RepID=A0ABY8HCI3_ENSAD|nr:MULTISPECIES: carnitine 3-dehydrogenase [Ensifer]OWZ94183.1 carnitine 3-dehydrogenase [Sinorhizobium sp. LM21]ANK73171.1 3-hydroxyacyl-CoA dehydrogenase [Ensifer adhaerens]KDP74961.1 3-hydroxyacyl-CoA dehydrogenase [Ensifer adhaerens]KQX32459.1 3-hydroxyacyl-CoA dehydrogenase [Ensifer sp. Root423]KQX60269.1 3-hydroxyacyl-CoA dehydrogenase [Ensifer sp. Root1298]
MSFITKAACVGGGVIGGAWVARFALAGIDVKIFDPHPEAERIIGEVMANAERAYAMLTMAPLPPKGKLTFCKSIEEAVEGADWIQESVPERLELKRGVITKIDAAARPDALIGSSTSGLLPSDLQSEMHHPERMFVAHPYNPVYLLPLVELVGGKKTSKATIERAMQGVEQIGMKGVVIAKEIEAFVGDRLLEALWREALWLIQDDICDTETLDNVMRYSFGMRWAQMGLFETYRIAGGEAGMRHFLAQFGPCLKWPWTKFTDVVDLDDALVEKIGAQSDAQAAGRSIRELERIRDENLVGIMHALKSGNGGEGWGAGKLLADFEAKLWANARKPEADLGDVKPLRILDTKVSAAWVDYNGHMTEHRYLQVFGDTSDGVLRLIGVDLDYVRDGHSYYTVETHIRNLGEAKLGEALYSTCQILSSDEKRLHIFSTIYNAATNEAVATAEQMMLHVDSKAGKAVAAPEAVLSKLRAITEAHAQLQTPDGAGRFVGQKRA